MLLLGLIVYPGALSSYGVVLIVPLLVLWRFRDAFPGRAATVCRHFRRRRAASKYRLPAWF